MAEEIKATEKQETPEVVEVIEEIKNADEETLKETIEKWYEKTRTDGMRLGAQYICWSVFAAIRKHTTKPGKTSMRDYERCIKDIEQIVKVPIGLDKTTQNDSEEKADDGTAAETN